MKQALKNAVKNNAQLASAGGVKADDALKYTQAAVNAANALRALQDVRD